MMDAKMFVPGDCVLTSYGVGVIVKYTQHDGDSINESNDAEGGAIKLPPSFYMVRLWRVPGKSIGSSSIGYLQPNAILKKVPVAPGMITKRKVNDNDNSETTKEEPIPLLVHAYYAHSDMYVVSPCLTEAASASTTPVVAQLQLQVTDSKDSTDKEEEKEASQNKLNRLSRFTMLSSSSSGGIGVTSSISSLAEGAELQKVPSTDIQPAASAKFYPLLQELMRRGDQTASATSALLAKPEVTEMVKQTKKTWEETTATAANTASTFDANKVQEIKDTVQTQSTEQAKQLFQMLKDEEFTVLLENGKKRLEQLMSQEYINKAKQQVLEKTMGIRVVADDEITESDTTTTAAAAASADAAAATTTTTTTTAKDGEIVPSAANTTSHYMKSINESRQAALAALDAMLKQTTEMNMEEIIEGDHIQKNLKTMMESFASAAKSDRTLSGIFETVTGKTDEWQQATGLILQTKSASLFLEGAKSIQQRAANLFSTDQLKWAGEIGMKLTKAFTEGDAAVARLKTIELGENVRTRLVKAIEVRSESLGGLDGIIAGALTTIGGGDGGAGGDMMAMLSTLQGRATSATKDAHETLISVLAKRSDYRDVALLKVEQVLCDLESQIDMSPEDIASIARGEGGTAKLFEPIAKRAAKEIEKQLDAAEASVKDQTMVDVLKHVRKIVSGELTLNAVLDEVVNILNDDKVVAAGETLVKHGEHVLDAIEGVSGNKVVDEVMQIAEKAGITKDSVMTGIEKLDVNNLLDTAGNAMTDERARKELLSSATDTALDFILKILPSMPVPPFDGVRDGLVYHVSNLSMEGFHVRKENIVVEIAGMQATKRAKNSENISEVTIDESNKQDENIKKENVNQSDGDDEVVIEGEESDDSEQKEDSKTGKVPPRSRVASADSLQMLGTQDGARKKVKATELLIIDVSEISAEFNDAMWSFEQTYLPYLKGNGKADVKMSDGGIRLVFELRRRRKHDVVNQDTFDPSEWEPVLCLHDRMCSIGSVDLKMQGTGRLAWVVNKLATIFKGPLRDYVVRTIVNILTNRSGWILERLNQGLGNYWDLIMRTAKLEMEELVEADQEVVVAAKPATATNLFELVWNDPIPLGMNLLLNDESGQLKVIDFPRGSQARSVCERRNLDPDAFEGATIVAVNGTRFLNEDDLFDALRDPSRPKTVSFELAESADAERIRKFVESSMEAEFPKQKLPVGEIPDRIFALRDVEFVEDGELGIEFANTPDNFGLVVRKFLESDDGIVLAAQRKTDIHEGDLLTHINGKIVLGENGTGRIRAMELLESEGTTRPLKLTLTEPYIFREHFQRASALSANIGGPMEIVLEEKQNSIASRRIMVKEFKDVEGAAEYGSILIGDHLVFVNGVSVGAGCRWLGEHVVPTLQEVFEMLTNKASYPIGLTFARPKKVERSRWALSSPRKSDFTIDSADTICVTADTFEQLGCVLEERNNGQDIVVTDFNAVAGPIQTKMNKHKDEYGRFHVSIDSVNGQFVPGYATTQIVKSAIDRSWKNDGRVELLLCDDERKRWTHALLQSPQQQTQDKQDEGSK